LVDANSTALGSWVGSGPGVGVFGVDGDGLFFIGSPARDGLVPYALVGVGARLLDDNTDGVVGSASWSYGAGVRTPIASWASLEGEVRHREPVSIGALPSVVSAGWEFRFGASVKVKGGARRVRPPAPAPVERRRAPVAAPVASTAATASARHAVALRALDVADDYLGTPYVWGGNTPEEGFDCSGFVRFVFAREGIDLPRVSRDQARVGEGVPLDLRFIEAGDLIAFASDGHHVDHIGIYAGDGRFIHASSSGNGVRWDDLHTERGRWYLEHMVAARRIITGGAPLYGD
jgi:cell wall-associated NlpC family hydrolase